MMKFLGVFLFVLGYCAALPKTDQKHHAACEGGLTITEPPSTGTVLSPGFEDGIYPHNLDCEWIFQGFITQIVYVGFTHFDLEYGNNCQYDYVQLFDTDELIGEYCGNDIPQAAVSSTSKLRVVFHSDYSNARSGWSFNYYFLDYGVTTPPPRPETWPGCYGSVWISQNEQGLLTSPLYPSEYFANADCQWLLRAPVGKGISLDFLTFQVEYDLTCSRDSLAIYDGPDVNAPVIDILCGYDTPLKITSSSHEVFLHFTSNAMFNYDGFLIQYSHANPTVTTTLPPLFTCKSDDFPCLDGQCVDGDAFCDGSRDCDDGSDEEYCLVTTDCGRPEVPPLFQAKREEVASRIVGGNVARPGSWPWQAAIRIAGGALHHCGGTLVHPQFVLTAAHCMTSDLSLYTVQLGSWQKDKDDDTQVSFSVSQILTSPDFQQGNYDNDIALIKLDRPADLTTHIDVACLPRQDQLYFDGMDCYATGWGDTEGTGGDDYLKQAHVELIDRDRCNEHTWYDGLVTENMICAGYMEGGTNTCDGDDGGPLVSYYGGSYKVIGVTSWRHDCSASKKPGVYAKVSKHVAWIEVMILIHAD